MKLSNDIRHGRHCVSALHVHLAFVTKYRRKVFDGDALQRLKAIFEKVCCVFQAQLVEMNGEAEHVYFLWSPSYFAASCGGAPLGIIKQYVEQQKTPL
jgi:putative transposase